MLRFRKCLVMIFVFAVALFTAVGVQAAKLQLLLANGGYTTGTWYMGAVAISEIANKSISNVNLTTIPGGGVSNCKAVARGRADFGFTYQDIAYAAHKRQKPFTEAKYAYEDIRGIASFASQSLHVVVKDKSDIQTIPDLVGKRVCAGYVGSGYEKAFRQLLSVYGLSPQAIEAKGGKYIYVSMNDAVSMMKDGLADAMVALSGIPASYFLDLSTAFQLRLLPIDEAHQKKYLETYPGWEADTIPAGSYGIKKGVPSVAAYSGLICNAELSEDLVYQFTKHMYEQRKKIADAHVGYSGFGPDLALKGIAVPLHPGAEKFWKEIGLIK